jgi:hypothetical protein
VTQVATPDGMLPAMSFDVFFQRFLHGERHPGGGDLMREILKPYIVRDVPDQQFAYVEIGDGSADIYLDQNDMLANHVSGEDPWDLMVRGARAADWVIVPVGCSTCITDESQRAHLPQELGHDVALVKSGADLLGVIRSA